MSEPYKLGPLSTDMGITSRDARPFFLDVTVGGIAVVLGRELIGYVSADELRAVVKLADERCPTCGQPKDAWARLEEWAAQSPSGWTKDGGL